MARHSQKLINERPGKLCRPSRHLVEDRFCVLGDRFRLSLRFRAIGDETRANEIIYISHNFAKMTILIAHRYQRKVIDAESAAEFDVVEGCAQNFRISPNWRIDVFFVAFGF